MTTLKLKVPAPPLLTRFFHVIINNVTKFARTFYGEILRSTTVHVVYFDKYHTEEARQSSFQIYQFNHHRHQQAIHNIFHQSLLTN